MAFKLEVLRGTTTYDISNGNPFSFDKAEGMGGASVRTIEERGPFQDGATHLDYRLEPRTITLSLLVQGTAASTLDGHRDTLTQIFKPVRGVPITLKLTRDDGKVRQIDTQRTGPSDIPLVPINRPGNLHRAVVQLRAADPVWYDPTEKTTSFVAPEENPWWTAAGSIPAANALSVATNPTNGQQWGGVGTITSGSPWTIFVRTNYVANSGSQNHIYTAGGFANFFKENNTTGQWRAQVVPSISVSGTLMIPGTHGYYSKYSGGTFQFYRGTTQIGLDSGTILPDTFHANTGQWGALNSISRIWTGEIYHAALYNIALTDSQIAALDTITSGPVTGTINYNINIAYKGDTDSYPVITVKGPVTDLVIVNQSTGDTLGFTGSSLGTDDMWTIDLRYGRKSVLTESGSSAMRYLNENSDLATFRLVPHPVATGGTNILSLSGGGIGTATNITVDYYDRYLGF